MLNMVNVHASFEQDFISLACKFNALYKKYHSLSDDPRILLIILAHYSFFYKLSITRKK